MFGPDASVATATTRVPMAEARPAPHRLAQLAALDFGGFTARRATMADLPAIAALREAGFGRTLRGHVEKPACWLDGWDVAPGAHNVVAEADGRIVAAMRLSDSRFGPLELAGMVDLPALLPGRHLPLLQCARLCAAPHPRRMEALFALQKAMWRRALKDGVQSLVLATPYWSRWMYEALQFTDLGDAAGFTHPLTGVPHRVMIFDVPSAQARLEGAGNPLAAQLFRTIHPGLNY